MGRLPGKEALMRNRFSRLWPWLLAALFLLTLIPIFVLGQYARPAADDYGYGIFTHWAVQTGEGFLRAVWHTATGYYKSWQGTFSALALMSLTPCIWSEQAYWITPVVMLLALVIGTTWLMYTLCVRLAGGHGGRQWYSPLPCCSPPSSAFGRPSTAFSGGMGPSTTPSLTGSFSCMWNAWCAYCWRNGPTGWGSGCRV